VELLVSADRIGHRCPVRTLIRVLKNDVGQFVSLGVGFSSRHWSFLSARVVQHPAHCVRAFPGYVPDPQRVSFVPGRSFCLISIALGIVSASRCSTTGTLSCVGGGTSRKFSFVVGRHPCEFCPCLAEFMSLRVSCRRLRMRHLMK
jgi:hypothetical protein